MNKSKRITAAVIFWILTAAAMFMIFRFSCDDGDESAEISENLLSVIVAYIGKFISHNVLRKIAHFCEFAALGFFAVGAFRYTLKSSRFYYPLILCVCYAVSDEIHQYFVPGRACRIFDVFIDSCGSLCGIGLFCLTILIILKILQKKAAKNR